MFANRARIAAHAGGSPAGNVRASARFTRGGLYGDGELRGSNFDVSRLRA